jgi:hypothetical protein
MTRRSSWATGLALAAAIAGIAASGGASAQSNAGASGAVRLRGDALLQARAPTGVVVLQGQGAITPALGVEVLLWGGGGDLTSPEGDLLVAALAYVDPRGRGELRAGRMLVTAGALRPLALDGLSVLGRAGAGTSLQLFAGLPVSPRFSVQAWDWAAGARLAQAIGPVTLGGGYLQRRAAGQLDAHEVALDAVAFPAAWLDLGARGALDLVSGTIAEAVLTSGLTLGAVRVSASAVHRVPAHLLPATSLFSVLGASRTTHAEVRVDWRATPRLDLSATLDGAWFEPAVYAGGALLGQLRLGRARDAGVIGGELRRQSAPGTNGLGGWVGARVFVRVPLVSGPGFGLALASEVELVRPDQPTRVGDGSARGAWWPWGLVALTARPLDAWEVSLAAEASASPEARAALDVLARATYLWGAP